MVDKPKYSFIFPIHNEEDILRKEFLSFHKWLNKYGLNSYEIIFIENGSIDASKDIIQSLKNQYPNIKSEVIKKASYGRAIKQGILSSAGNFIVILNIDFLDYSFLEKALPKCEKRKIIVGPRNHSLSNDKRPWYRIFFTYLHTFLLQLFFKYPGNDTHGIKIIPNDQDLRSIIKTVYTINELFDSELLVRLYRKNYKIDEIPVTVSEIRPSRYNPIKRVVNIFKDVFRFIFSITK